MTPGRRAAWVALGCAAVLAACASRPAPTEPSLSGRLAVRVEGHDDRSFSAGFELTGSPAHGRLTLISPLGTAAAQAGWEDGQAWLLTGNGRTEYPDLAALAVATLGEPVPLGALFDWLRGRPWSGAATEPRRDGLAGFEQLGWRVDLTRWDEGWIEARRDSVPVISVRAKIERS